MRRKHRRPTRKPRTILRLEVLEDRTLLNGPGVTGGNLTPWVEQGPQAFPAESVVLGDVAEKLVLNGEFAPDQNDLVAGAVEAIAVHPHDPDTLLVGTVNGGIWKTTTARQSNANDADDDGDGSTDEFDETPVWEPKTDLFPSLSIGALAYSPLDNLNQPLTAVPKLANEYVLYAGTGVFSSLMRGGPTTGILRSTDGGDSWQWLGQSAFAGLQIRSIVPTRLTVPDPTGPGGKQQIVLAAATDRGESLGLDGGIFRSEDGGATWESMSGVTGTGLPPGAASHLVAHPTNANLFYAAIPGVGIYRNNAGGQLWKWEKIDTGIGPLVGTTRIELAISPANPDLLYAAVIGPDSSDPKKFVLSGIFQLEGTTWRRVGPPTGVEVTPNGQANRHFALTVDPLNARRLFVAGDAHPDRPGGANIYRVDTAFGSEPDVWTPIVRQHADDVQTNWDTAPHADARDLVFDQTKSYLLEADDGGIFRLSNPRLSVASPAPVNTITSPLWDSLNGSLRNFESVSVAYDSVNQVFLAGNQDNGSSEQKDGIDNDNDGTTDEDGEKLFWREVGGGDGAGQAVGVSNGHSFRYSMGNNWGSFIRREFDAANVEVTTTPAPLAPHVLLARPGRKVAMRNHLSGLNARDWAFAKDRDKVARIEHALNRLDPDRLVIGYYGLYESPDRGDHIHVIPEVGGEETVSAIAAGGRKGGAENKYVLYVARADRIGVRKAAGETIRYAKVPHATRIRDIVLDPDNWERAYAVDDTRVYWTEDAGGTWTEITGSLAGRESLLPAVELLKKPGQNTVLLVGGTGGVYRTVFDDKPPASPRWTEVGAGLPNAVVAELNYEPTLDALTVATLGRGVWTLPAAGLAAPVVLEVQGGSGPDQIDLRINARNPLFFDVVINSQSYGPYPVANFDRIKVLGGDGADTVTLDTVGGLIGVDIEYDGQAGVDAFKLTGPLAVGFVGSIRLEAEGKSQLVTFTDVETMPDNLANPQSTIPAILTTLRDGLEDLVRRSADLAGPDGLGEALAGFGSFLGDALNGRRAADVPLADDLLAAPRSQFLRRVFEEGSNALNLAEIGTTITSTEELRRRFDALDTSANNVTVSQSNGVVRYDVRVQKPLGSQARFDVDFTPRAAPIAPSTEGNPLGPISLNGQMTAAAQVDVHFVFGVDQRGFFIDLSGDTSPNVVVSKLAAIDVQGTGRFGVLGVTLTGGTLTADQNAGVALTLRDPGTDAADNLVRPAELGAKVSDLVAVSFREGSATPDVTLSGTVAIETLIPGLESLVSQLPPTSVTLTWDRLNDPAAAVPVAAGAAGAKLLNLLNVSTDQLLGSLAALASRLQASAGQGLLNTPIPLTGKTLGQILDGTSAPLAFTGTTTPGVDAISEVVEQGGFKKFVATIGETGTTPTRLSKLGIAVGDAVTFKDKDNVDRTGTVDRVDESEFTVRFDKSKSWEPNRTAPSFTVARTGSLLRQLTAGLGDLADANNVPLQAPTLQDLLARLSDILGVDPAAFGVTLDGPTTDPALRLMLDYEPAPFAFTQKLGFGDRLKGLDLKAGGDFTFTLTPHFHLGVGLRLGDSATLGITTPADEVKKRFFVVADPDPEVTIKVQASLDNPNVETSIGFLDVVLAEKSLGGVENKGLTVGGTVTVNLADPDASTPGRITLAELLPPVGAADNLAQIFQAGIDPLDPLKFDIDGLQVTVKIGSGDTSDLPVMSISLDEEGAGKVTSETGLKSLLQGLTISNETEFLKFNRITPEMILAALKAVADQLGALGVGGLLDRPLPVIGKSIGQLTDLATSFQQTVGAPTRTDALTARGLQTFLNNQLGGDIVHFDVHAGEIQFRFNYTKNLSTDVPLNFDLKPLSGAIHLSGSGTAHLAGTAAVNLTLGVTTDDTRPMLERVFLGNTSTLTVNATANVGYEGLPALPNFSVKLGNLPGNLRIEDGRVLIRNLGFTGQVQGSGGRLFLHQAGTASFQGNLTGDIQAQLPLRSDSASTLIEVAGLVKNLDTIAFEDPPDPSSSGGVVTPLDVVQLHPDKFQIFANDLSGFLVGAALDLTGLKAGLDKLLKTLDDLLGAEVLKNLPLVGDLASKVQFLKTFIGKLGLLDGKIDMVPIQQALFDILTAGDLNILGELDGQNGITKEDILITPTAIGPATNDVQFKLHLNHELPLTVPLGVGLGLPKLGLQVDGNVEVVLKFDAVLGFGYSRFDGFYFDTSAAKELDIGLDVRTSGLDVGGRIGFLNLTAHSNPGLLFSGNFTLDVTEPSGDGRLTFEELSANLGNLGDLFDARLNAKGVVGGVRKGAHVTLDLTADFGSAQFPSLKTQFTLDWEFDSADPTSELFGDAPQIAFSNVKLDVGTFLNRFIKPIATRIQQVLKPIRPILDVLTEPVPVLSTLLKRPVTLLDLAERLGLIENGEIIEAIVDIDRAAEVLTSFTFGEGTTYLDLGSFNLGSADIRKVPDLKSVVPSAIGSVGSTLAAFEGLNLGGSPQNQETVKKFVAGKVAGKGLSFPLLEDPTSAFGLLLGRDADLFLYDMPTFRFGFTYSQFFPILGPLGARITGSIGASAHFQFGFDTTGLREFAESNYDPSMLDEVFTRGFFIDNRGGPQLTLEGKLEAGVVINIFVAEVGVSGDITATVNFKLRPEEQEKIRLNDVLSTLEKNPLCLFDVHGKFTAGLSAHIKIGFDTFFGFVTIFSKRFELARVTLLEFKVACPDDAPVIAGMEAPGVLRLFMGTHAGSRNVDADKIDETYTVSKDTTPGAGANDVIVSAFGIQQPFKGVTKIVADGHTGNDQIVINDGVRAEAELLGGGGQDTLLYRGGNTATLRGGDGNDTLEGGAGADELYGDKDNDTLAGGGGDDTLEGGDNDDLLRAGKGTGNNASAAEDGNVILRGGDGPDTLTGGAGNDVLEGGAGDDEMESNDGIDFLFGGDDNDTLDGGAGTDILDGGKGDDSLFGGADSDGLIGGQGRDQLDGDDGDDRMVGGSATALFGEPDGDDTLAGGAGDDALIGDNGLLDPFTFVFLTDGFGNDLLDGGDGNDRLFGQGGDDVLRGGAGNDDLVGDAFVFFFVGNDTLEGAAGDDNLAGGFGSDLYIYSGLQLGNDKLFDGGPCLDRDRLDFTTFARPIVLDLEEPSQQTVNDTNLTLTLNFADGIEEVIGTAFDDVVHGNCCANLIEGQNGNDFLEGREGGDGLIGGLGEDTLHGNSGNDVLIGDQGIAVVALAVAPLGPDVTGSGTSDLSANVVTAATPGLFVAGGDVNGDGTDDVITAPVLGSGQVQVFSGADGSVLRSFYPFGSGYLGGVTVAAGDIDGDGKDDIITGAATGSVSIVQVFSGADGKIIRSFLPYTGAHGVTVGSGDVDGDGRDDIITGPAAGGGVRVNVYSGATGAVLRSFDAYGLNDVEHPDGLFVAAGDVNADGKDDIVTGPIVNGTLVRVFSGADGATLMECAPFATANAMFTATETTLGSNFVVLSMPITVAAGDVNGDGKDDVIAGTGLFASHVTVLSGADCSVLLDCSAFLVEMGEIFTEAPGGVTVAAGLVNGDGRADIIVATATGAKRVKVLDGVDCEPLPLDFPMLGVIIGLVGTVDQTAVSGDLLLAGEGADDTLIGHDGDDVLFGDNGIAVVVGVAIPIYDDLLSPGGGAGNPAPVIAVVTPPPALIGILGDITLTGVAGNVALNGSGGDDILYGDDSLPGTPGDDILFGDNGTLIYVAVLVIPGGSPLTCSEIAEVPETAEPIALDTSTALATIDSNIIDSLPGGQSNVGLVGVLGDVTLTGVTGNVSLTGTGGKDTLYGHDGDDIMTGDNGVVVSVKVGFARPEVPATADPSSTAFHATDLGTISMTAQLIELEGIVLAPPPLLVGVRGNIDELGVGGDVVLMGSGADDTLTGAGGDDIMTGDNAAVVSVRATFAGLHGAPANDGSYSAQAVTLSTMSFALDDTDTIGGGSSPDFLVSVTGDVEQIGVEGSVRVQGGAGNDLPFTGDDDDDIMTGDNAVVVSVRGELVTALDAQPVATVTDQALAVASLSMTDTSPSIIVIDDPGSYGPQAALLGTLTQTGVVANVVLDGDAGNDSPIGGTGDDVVSGDNAVVSDVRLALALETDTLGGGGSNDPIAMDLSNLSLTDLPSGISSATQTGIGGSVSLTGDAGSEQTLTGDQGADVLTGDNAIVTTVDLFGTVPGGIVAGSVTQTGVGGDAVLNGDADKDTVQGGSEDDILSGDNAIVSRVATNISGTDAGQTVVGGALTQRGIVEDVSLSGADADDLLLAGIGNDTGVGDNAVVVHVTATIPIGTPLTPAQTGVGGAVSLTGTGGGDDLLRGDIGLDILIGDDGVVGPVEWAGSSGTWLGGLDCLEGGSEDDVLLGDDGHVRLAGTNVTRLGSVNPQVGGNDTVLGDLGNDSVVGGGGRDEIGGGFGNDLIFGDHGRVDRSLPANQSFTSLATGSGQGDRDTVHGDGNDDTVIGGQGDDSLYGDDGNDDLIGGHNVAGGADGGDTIDGGTGHDAVLGDNGSIVRRFDTRSPLFRVLTGTTLYNPDGTPAVTATPQFDPRGRPGRDIALFDVSTTALPSAHGNDSLAGGAGDDSVFGQSGNDVLQGDSSVSVVASSSTPSVAALSDGDDYLEGGGGDDVLFGNLGQDDLIGGSSDLFGQSTPDRRPDGSDFLFGGVGADARNSAGDTSAAGHSRDADVLVGDNGTILRPVSGGAFRTFQYDTGTPKVIARVVRLLDYTPGGSAGDIGPGDVIRGGAGDDTAHGGAGNDVITGDGQDDDLYGGAGNDWISGGTGDDGILGDDGRIWTSRNGTEEPLYGLAGVASGPAPTPAGFPAVLLYPTGRLNKTVDLEPFDAGGSDTAYGGLGHDSLHGGGGNDALSGAEALSGFYSNPTSTPLVEVDPATCSFVGFDPNQGLKKIANQALNFEAFTNAADPAGSKVHDGDDVVFGDGGNDWLVGGTNADRLYGGLGNDLLNADDNLETNTGANDVPDAAPFDDADLAYGGGGRDSLVGGSASDRLVDWVAPYDLFYVPFAPVAPTVTADIAPLVPEFLYAVSKSDGADPTRVGPGLGTSARNGEPFGELGLLLPSDADFINQTTNPVITDVLDVAPDPRNAAVDAVDVVFNKAISLATFDRSDLILRRNRVRVALPPTLTFTQVRPTTYRIGGLAGLTLMDGRYVLRVDSRGIEDLNCAPGLNRGADRWLMDTTAPVSHVRALAARQTTHSFTVRVAAQDPAPAPGVEVSGVASVEVYVSDNGGPFLLATTLAPGDRSFVFVGVDDHTYAFHSVARDAAGNVENKSPTAVEASTYVPDLTAPVTSVTAVDSSTANLVVSFSGTDSGGSGLSFFDVFVQIDGGAVQQIAHQAAGTPTGGVYGGTLTYRALRDGVQHTYRFFSVGIDGNGNTEAAPGVAQDVIVTATFPPPPQVTGFDVQHGATGRSFVRYLTLTFNQTAGLAQLVAGGRIRLWRFDLNGHNGQLVDLTGRIRVIGNVIEIDFGAQGIGGNRTSTAGDGYYKLELDLDEDGTFDTARSFYRLLGDVNGDRKVKGTDVAFVNHNMGSTGPNLDADVNGDGVVDSDDRRLVIDSLNRRLADGLHLDD